MLEPALKPLTGFTIVEMAGLGPCPFAGMLLADMGARVILVERPMATTPRLVKPENDINRRGKESLVLDLKDSAAIAQLRDVIGKADALIEGFRPGVMERLGLSPADCHARQPRLVYGRMTGWGQTGPLAQAAGHDINYIALSGALHAMGREGDKPVPPLNLVGDYGGGAMYLVMGVLAALLSAERTGQGCVIDAAMTDGSASLMSLFYALHAQGHWHADKRGINLLDSGAPFYDTYETADGKWISIGAIEPQFYSTLLDILCAHSDLNRSVFAQQNNRQHWPDQKRALTQVFKTKTRDGWCALLEGTDACFAPVLDMLEAAEHPHNRARQSIVTHQGVLQPAPAPRFRQAG